MIDAWLAEELAFLVATSDDGSVRGFARVCAYSDRRVHSGVGEHGVDVARTIRGRRIGRLLLGQIAAASEHAGLYTLTSRVFTENLPSRAAHLAAGFHEVGVQRRHGKLDGEWKDCLLVKQLFGRGCRRALSAASRPHRTSWEPKIEYFFYCRDRPDTGQLRDELIEAHWSFMDAYSELMIARGPTLSDDGDRATGSMHIVDLPDAGAARVFAFEEPNYLAGVYRDVLIRRWHNTLSRTMWDFVGAGNNDPRFLVIGHARPAMTAVRDGLRRQHRRYFFDRGYRDWLIACGPLLSDDASEWLGSALLVELPRRAAVDELLAASPYVRARLYASLEIHP